MAIHAAIRQLIHDVYGRPVQLGAQVIRRPPAPHSRPQVLSHAINRHEL